MEGEGEGGIRPRGPRNAQYLPPTVTFRGFIRPPVDRQNNEVAAVWKPAEKWPFFAIACISAYLNRRPASISLFRKRPLRDVTPDRWHRINFLRGRGPFEWVADRIWIAFDCFWTARVCLSNARDGIKFLITWSLNQVFKKTWCEVFFKVVFFSLKSFVPLNFDSNWLGIIVDREISLNFLNLENLSSSWILEIQFFWMLKVHRIIFICKIFLFDLVFGREHETTAVEMFFRLSTGIN